MSHDEKPTSIWKKELSFKRRAPGDGDAPDSAPPVEGAEPASVWKKEISLRRKPKEVAAPVAEKPAVAPPLSPAVPAEPVVVAPSELPVAPPVDLPPAATAVPVTVDHSWLTQPLEEVSNPVEDSQPADTGELSELSELTPTPFVSVQPDELDPALTFAPEPQREHEPVAALPLPPVTPEVIETAFSSLAPALPAELVAAAAAILAPAVSEPPVAEKQPLHRRMVSLARGPKAEKAPKAPREERSEKVPLHKRELSFGRRAKPSAAAEVAPTLDTAATVEIAGWDETDVKKPFYKRELSFGRTPKAAPSETRAPKAASEPKQPRQAKTPRELPSLRRLSRPKPLAAGGKPGSKLVGLKIGASQIAAARIVNGPVPELLQVAREPLEPGIVVGGELRDPEALALALRDFFKKHGLPKRGVRLGIANNRIGVRTFDVTGIDDPKQLANAIRFRAQEVLPIAIEEAVLDYQILSESRDGEGNVTRRVLLVVAYRELVDRYVHACAKAGIQIVGIDLEAFALLRALAEPRDPVPGSDRGALVAVSVGHDRSTFAVSDGRVCEFTRVLEWGGWALNVAIARELDLSPGEAEPVKRALSFVGHEQVPDGFTEDQLATAREAARRQLQSFARELVSSLQFYQNQPGSLGIGEIVLTGGTAHLPGFGAELERLIGVPVRVGDPLVRLKVSKKIQERDQTGSLAIAIGLGIED